MREMAHRDKAARRILIRLETSPDRKWVRHADAVIPERFWATIEDDRYPRCELEIRTINGRLECVGLVSEQGLRGADLRKLPLDTLVRQAHVAATFGEAVAIDNDGHFRVASPAPATMTADEYEQRLTSTSRRRSITDDFLREVATVYRQAIAEGKPPTKAVASRLHGSPATAGRWVMQARERGFLGRATRGRRGELAPDTSPMTLAEAQAAARAWAAGAPS